MTLSAVLLLVINILFLILGVLLLGYAETNGIELPAKNDAIFTTISLSAGTVAALLFMFGLVSAGFSSADGSLASLTTAWCLNILNFDKREDYDEEKRTKIRKTIHCVFALLFFIVIVVFRPFHSDSLIATIFVVAGYTYGPLLGMFCFGMTLKNRTVNDKVVPFIAVLSPIISYVVNRYSDVIFFGYKFGFEILLFNALLTYLAMLAFSKKKAQELEA